VSAVPGHDRPVPERFTFMKESLMEDIQQLRMQLLAYQTLIAALLAKTSPTINELERMRRAIRRSATFHPMDEQSRDSAGEYAAAIEDVFLSASLVIQDLREPPAVS
jgi:hypothetical protein